MKKLNNKDRKPLSDDRLTDLERYVDAKGGVNVTIATEYPDGKELVHYHYSSHFEDLQLKEGRTLEVAVSSMDQENEALLHFLLRRV